MTELKHTLAPWEVKIIEHPFSFTERKFGNKTLPAMKGVHKQYVVQTAWEHGQAKAKVDIFGHVIATNEPEPITYVSAWNKHDAYLAAAAPDLLKALIEIESMVNKSVSQLESYGVTDWGKVLANAQQAIEKATA